ncbi:hypothetical protein ABK040_008681 [Willaertia magna]
MNKKSHTLFKKLISIVNKNYYNHQTNRYFTISITSLQQKEQENKKFLRKSNITQTILQREKSLIQDIQQITQKDDNLKHIITTSSIFNTLQSLSSPQQSSQQSSRNVTNIQNAQNHSQNQQQELTITTTLNLEIKDAEELIEVQNKIMNYLIEFKNDDRTEEEKIDSVLTGSVIDECRSLNNLLLGEIFMSEDDNVVGDDNRK